jgi:F-box/leucine-rich repeat protein 10/11
MQMGGSFVDFHIELTGTTTWYHLHKGIQFYFLIPPLDENIQKLKEWRATNFVGTKSVFFGNLVRRCTCIKVVAGQTLIVPSGWIRK